MDLNIYVSYGENSIHNEFNILVNWSILVTKKKKIKMILLVVASEDKKANINLYNIFN